LLQQVVKHPQETLGALVAAGDSPDAAYLRHLSRSEVDGRAYERSEHARRVAAERPATPVLVPGQLQLAKIWADVLKIEVSEIRPSDNFFDLGGDSLQAMRVIQVAERTLGFRTAPPRYVFETLSQLASREAAFAEPVGEARRAGSGAKKLQDAPARSLLGKMFSGWGKAQRSS
jgi:hypothetical protein